MTTVSTGWRLVTPGACPHCGEDDGWHVSGRGGVICECEACPECGEIEAGGGWHAPGCPVLAECACEACEKERAE